MVGANASAKADVAIDPATASGVLEVQRTRVRPVTSARNLSQPLATVVTSCDEAHQGRRPGPLFG